MAKKLMLMSPMRTKRSGSDTKKAAKIRLLFVFRYP